MKAWPPRDLREIDAPQRLVDAAVAQFGGIDIVVNNAGATRRGAFLNLSEEDWQDSFALKFFGSCSASPSGVATSEGSIRLDRQHRRCRRPHPWGRIRNWRLGKRGIIVLYQGDR